VTQEWVRRGRFQLASSADQADAVLSATVVSANVSPVRFDDQRAGHRVPAHRAADVQLVDRTGEKR